MKRHVALLSWTVAVVLALGAIATAAVAQQPAQQAERVPRIGVLATSLDGASTQGFLRGLRDFGYVEGQNIVINYRFNEGRGERLPGLAAELVDLQPDILVAVGAIHAQALKEATTTIPIVFAINPDAVESGLVPDNTRPGGNLTGFTALNRDQITGQLRVLRELNPGLARVAFFSDQDVADLLRGGDLLGTAAPQAPALGIELMPIGLQTAHLDVEGAFETARRGRAEAVLSPGGPAVTLNRNAIAALAIQYRLPTIFPPDFVDDSWQGLIAYGTSLAEAGRLVPSYMARILQGEDPGEMPVEAVTRQALIINLDTARQIGATIPSEVLERADRVIDSSHKP